MSKISVDENAIRRLLQKTKEQYSPGTMLPKIYSMLDKDGKQPSNLKLQWMFYTAMGNIDFHDRWQKNEKEAAEHLIHVGRLVPTTIKDHYGVMKVQLIDHFDDVNWAKMDDGRIVIFDIHRWNDEWADELIIPSGLQLKAVENLEKRLRYGSSIGQIMEGDPITLQDGTVITHYITNPNDINIRLRQKGLQYPN